MEKYKGKCLVVVSGEGCAGCVSAYSECVTVAKKFGLNLINADISANESVLCDFEILRVPAILLVIDGKEIAKCYGYQPQEILELWIEAKLEENK